MLISLDVAVEAFAVCEVGGGLRLVFEPLAAVVVHYVLAGELVLEVEGHDPVRCGPGSLAMVPAGARQALSNGAAQSDRPAEAHSPMARGGLLYFDATNGQDADLRVVCGSIMATFSGSFGLADRIGAPVVEDLSSFGFVRQAFGMLLEEITAPSLGTRALTGALMKSCLLLMVRDQVRRLGNAAPMFRVLSDERLFAAVGAILGDPAGQHTVASLSAVAGMSRAAFARRFAAAFGTGPIEFLVKTRLHHAADLLRSTSLPVKLVASSIGFRSRSHFSRAFTAAYGIDPSRFRRSEATPGLAPPRSIRGDRSGFAVAEEPGS